MSEQAPIHQLSDDLANKIAAGEVIERPAAVVKELVENSLDARAQRITVRIADGGQRLIEVHDDGHGIRASQLELALARHATSKLQAADDLFAIGSLGFRGEALPSIAGVSEMELASRTDTAEEGRLLRVAGDRREALKPCAMPVGTRVTVRNLFWNVPARLKFLKSAATETGHVTDMLMRLALGHPQVAFRLEVGERVAFDLPRKQTLRDRIRACFGKQMAEGLLEVERVEDHMQVLGFCAHPRLARPSTKRQFVFLNGRYLHDKLLVAAIREGYAGFCEPRLHGAVFLHIAMEPNLVDVNVHPTKAEVRFRNGGSVFSMLSGGLKAALADEAGGFPLFTEQTEQTEQTAPASQTKTTSAAGAVVTPATPQIQERFLPRSPQPPAPSTDATRTASPSSGYETAASDPPLLSDDGLPAGVRQVIQVNDMYLLVESEHGIRLVDQHALHEKALWLSLDPAASDPGLGRQELLTPLTIDLGAAEIALLAELLEELKRYGIDAEIFGPTSLLLRAHPPRLAKVRWEHFFADLAATGNSASALADLRQNIAHRAACRSAIKAGTRLHTHEMHELVRVLYTLEHMEHCPHGRPTTLDLSWGELERRFQR